MGAGASDVRHEEADDSGGSVERARGNEHAAVPHHAHDTRVACLQNHAIADYTGLSDPLVLHPPPPFFLHPTPDIQLRPIAPSQYSLAIARIRRS